jgi:hypothetical protein
MRFMTFVSGVGAVLAAAALATSAAAQSGAVINNSEAGGAKAAPTGGPGAFPTNLGATPVNGIGGTGGGRFTFRSQATSSGGPSAFPTNVGATPVNGIGGTGGGRLTVQPAPAANVESSNRDHIDQDAQTDLKK